MTAHSPDHISSRDWTTYWRDIQGATATDQPIGQTTLTQLPPRSLAAYAAFHNGRVTALLKAAPKSWSHLSSKLRTLHIPTPHEFAELRSDTYGKQHIPAHLRGSTRGEENWKEWVLTQPPLTTVYRDFVRKKPIPVYLPATARAKHGLLLGQTGSGKSELLKYLLLRDISAAPLPAAPLPVSPEHDQPSIPTKQAVVLIEPTGNLSREVAKQRRFWTDAQQAKTQGEDPNLILFDPMLAAEDGLFPSFNPFDRHGRHLSAFEVDTRAQFLTSAFLAMLSSNNELSLHQATLLHPLLVLLVLAEKTSFTDLVQILRGDDRLIECNAHLLPQQHDQFLRQRLYAKSFDRTRASLETKFTSLLNYEIFQQVVCQPESTIDLPTVLNAGKTLVVSLPKGALGADVSSCIGRLFLASILAVAFGRSQVPPAARVPITVFLDEAQNFLGDEKTVPEALAEARQFRLQLLLAQQYLGQGMSPQLLNAIVSNTNVKIVGKSTVTTAKAMGAEMRTTTDSFHALRPGQFVVQCGSRPAMTCQVFDTHLGSTTEMTAGQWHDLRQTLIDRYYAAATPSPNTDTFSHDSQFHEDMAATGVPENEDPLDDRQGDTRTGFDVDAIDGDHLRSAP